MDCGLLNRIFCVSLISGGVLIILTLNWTKPAFHSFLCLKISEPKSFCLDGWLFVSSCVQLFSYGPCIVINFHSCFSN